MLHFVSTSSGGKTTSTRCGATVWGLGATTEVEGTFLKSWKTTANASESLLAGHNHIGLALDELKTVDARAAGTFAYDFASGRSKLRMNAKLATRQGPSWALFAISSGEVTLAERANDQAFRKQLQDAGAEARVINIPTDIDLFPNLHGHASGEAFAQALGAASTEHYGHAGPAFVRWLIANEKEARERLEANLAFWDREDGRASQDRSQSSSASHREPAWLDRRGRSARSRRPRISVVGPRGDRVRTSRSRGQSHDLGLP